MGNSFEPDLGVGVAIPLQSLPKRAEGAEQPDDESNDGVDDENDDWVIEPDLHHIAQAGVDLAALKRLWRAAKIPPIYIVLGRNALVNTYKFSNMDDDCFTVFFLSAHWPGPAYGETPAAASIEEVQAALASVPYAFFQSLTTTVLGGTQQPRLLAFIGGDEETM